MEPFKVERRGGTTRGTARPGHRFGGAPATATPANVYKAVLDWWQTEGRPPTLQELADIMGCKSRSAMHHPLNVLEQEGLIERDPALGRGYNRALWPAGLKAKIKELVRQQRENQ